AATAQRALDAARQRNLDLSREGVMALGRELEAEEAARLAAINHAGALAQMATQLGYSQQAADRWAEALAAADKAGWDLTQRVDLLTDAARASNDEFARTLEIQAQLAAEAGDASTAAALRAQLIGRLASREDGRSAPLATSRSGGAPRTDPMVAQRAEWARADKAFWDRYFAETSRQQADVDAARERAADADRQARIDAIYQQVDDLKAAQDAERQAAAERLSESLGSARSAADMLADSMVRLNGIDLSGLSVAVDQLQPLIDNIELLGSAQGKTREGMQKGASGIIAASGRATAALIKDQTAQAAIMAVMETAASIAAFAFQDYRAGTLHAVAAATYGIVAGMSAAGAGRGASGGAGSAGASRRDPGRS
ncbi:hypothetical protein EB061_12895, partial [bacterium]|nr:hypothetical protein [bacterium]